MFRRKKTELVTNSDNKITKEIYIDRENRYENEKKKQPVKNVSGCRLMLKLQKTPDILLNNSCIIFAL